METFVAVAKYQRTLLTTYDRESTYRALAPQLPESFREMEPLFLAVICGCNAGLFREALHEVYLPRIQRGNASFAAKVLGARGALLSALAHFFEQGRWGSPAQVSVKTQVSLPKISSSS